MTNVRIVIACRRAPGVLRVVRRRLSNARLPGISDLGEGDNLTDSSQIVTRPGQDGNPVDWVTVDLPVPPDTATKIKALFDPDETEKAEALADIKRLYDLSVAVEAIRSKPARDRTPEERETVREFVGERREVPGPIPTEEQFLQSINACRVWLLDADDTRTLERWFTAPRRVEQGWAWVEMPQPEPLAP
jgi:hypothetical protein